MAWNPHVTVATVVEMGGKFLMVEELDSQGRIVINQPAGHLEQHETLIEAARRETLEETAWNVKITFLLGIGLYYSKFSDITYFRTSFIAEAVHDTKGSLDEGILRTMWMSYDEILNSRNRLRSPLVLIDINKYRQGLRYPVDIINT